MANHKDTARPPTGEDLARDLWDLGVALNKAAALGTVEPDLTELRNLDTPDIFDSPEPDEDAPDEYGREDLTHEL